MHEPIYVILITPEASFSKVSDEGYRTFAEAVCFIEHRAKNPQLVSVRTYRDEDETEYKICEVLV